MTWRKKNSFGKRNAAGHKIKERKKIGVEKIVDGIILQDHERRQEDDPEYKGPEKRSEKDRRSGKDRRK